ncbi:MAG: hypothetical protein PHG49_02500 [Candidatus Pacebacteria bacterium]|nr:hypothetical protein [Candidatus Paceibacterota bacterium]
MKKIHFIVLSIFVFIFTIAYAGKTFYGASFYVKEIPAIMKACNTNEDCTIIETACCPCTSGGDPKTIKAINKIYAQSFKSSLQEKCTNDNAGCLYVVNCNSGNTPNKAICNNKECQAVIIHTGTSIPSYSPNLYIIDDYMKNCTSDNDCTIIDRAYCYTDITKEKITIDGSINKKYKDYYYKKYPNLYNEEYCNKNFPGGVKIGPQLPEPYPTETKSKCINNKCDSVRVRTSTTTKPTIN